MNAFALRIQRRYTHSILWRLTVGRLQAGHPSLLLGWQRYDRFGRVLNWLGLTFGLILVIAGLAS